MNRHKIFLIIFLIFILSIILSIYSGSTKNINDIILYKIRLPQAITAILVGIALSVSGAVYQSLFKNPLAEPYLLGTSSSAALGAVIVSVLSLPFFSFSVFFFAIILSFASMLVVYFLAKESNRTSIQSLILSGVIISAFMSSLIMLVMSLSLQSTYQIIFFLMGSLTVAKINLIYLAGFFITVGFIICLYYSKQLNALSIDEEYAISLGIETEKVKKILFFTTSAMVASAVAISGIIGFVGLIVPHLSRKLFGADNRILIPVSAFIGAITILIADIISRNIVYPSILPVGVITALFGAPFFLYIFKFYKNKSIKNV